MRRKTVGKTEESHSSAEYPLGKEPGKGLDDVDRRLLTEAQRGIPLSDRPFDELAERLGLPVPEVLARLRELRDRGLVRRFGGVFDTRALGFASLLVAAAVPPADLERVGAIVSECPGVTHNYAREGEAYNLWFTLSAASPEGVEAVLGDLAGRTGIERWLRLPTEKVFKIGVMLDLTPPDGLPGREAQAESPDTAGSRAGHGERPPGASHPGGEPPDPEDRRLISALQGDIPLTERPYAAIAESLGWQSEEVLERLSRLRERGWMRRVAATLYHRRAGFVANAMAIWRVAPGDADRAGRILAAFPQVSHCYLRPSRPSWPYNLYAMIHGRTEAECRRAAEEMAAVVGPLDHKLLFSTREFKKTSPVYYPRSSEGEKERGKT